ncbi:TRAP transporter small permease [Insolitispirillum peregrinum]|uniref:TRAP transporter small permease n=1 Tax=Insolitispirillum peregrinum TaxID=80876 RepID=UPI0036156171
MTELLYPPEERSVHDRIERWLTLAAEALAWAGGLILLALIGMSLVSIIARKLGFHPVNGDVELMQMGCAVASAAFLPLCTLRGDHLRVEFFTEGCRPVLRQRMDAVTDILLAAVFTLLAWRTGLQMLDSRDSGEIAALTALPLWIPVLLMIPSLALTVLCGLYRAVRAFFLCDDLCNEEAS